MNPKEKKDPRKKMFYVYYDVAETYIDEFDDEQLGKWFRSIAEFELYGHEPKSESDKAVRLAVKHTINQLSRDFDKFIEKCETNKDNRNREKVKKELKEKYNIVSWSSTGQLKFKDEKVDRPIFLKAFANGEIPKWAMRNFKDLD